MMQGLIKDHGTLITFALVGLFLSCCAYTVYVLWLDIRETREQAQHDADQLR